MTGRLSTSLTRVFGLLSALPLLAACNAQQISPTATRVEAPQSTPLITVMVSPSREADPTLAPTSASATTREVGFTIFHDEPSGLQFQFPQDWQGPSVYRTEGDVRVEIGTDTVYPYGTGLDARQYTVEDAYFVVIQYSPATSATLEQRKQMIEARIGHLRSLADGESVSGARALQTRVREIQLGRFRGLEWIDTLSDSAQTEFSYMRSIVLYDDAFNTITVSATPNNVTPRSEPKTIASMRADYGAVDEKHRPTLDQILESIVLS